uniref:CG-1 domain-containing protein n=1 Tax=Lotharella globosa TaxID=91324 RepID=A0A7S3Z627_9EUKA|mmetsp:Transcript_22068/g.44275  ORF Transcript_22068/g.44275 Transcript_22068/m.44275 type:complete len:527 (+) Transcript_22068:829-2409(+)
MSLKYEQMKAVIKAAKTRWLKVDECVDILMNYRRHNFPLSSSPAHRPSASGSVFLYNATTASEWFDDGYSWKTRGPGEYSHISIRGVGELVCVSNEHQMGFQRRGYWLAQQPHIVLVHYLAEASDPRNTNGLDVFYENSRRRHGAPPGGGRPMMPQRMDPRGVAGDSMMQMGKRKRDNSAMGASYDSAMLSNFPPMQPGSVERKKDGPPIPGEDKNAKRKARKAEVARACRRRKKAYIQSLEEKAARLSAKLQDMAKSQNGEATHRKDQDLLVGMIRNAINEGQGDRQIDQLIQRFVANSRKRQRTDTDIHVEKVVEAMSPGDQAKFTMWALDQGSDFLRGTGAGAWTELMQQIKLSPNQIGALSEKQKAVRKNWNSLSSLMGMISSLKAAISSHLDERHRLVDECVSLLSPTQAACIIAWVKENNSCMGRVNADWDAIVKPRHSHSSQIYSNVHQQPGPPNDTKIAQGAPMSFPQLNTLSQSPASLPPLSSEAAQLSIGDIPSGQTGELLSMPDPSRNPLNADLS